MTIGHSLVKLSIGILCATCAWSQQYTISTIAGTNVQGFSGDSGAAASAQLALPGRIAIDSSGKIYIADGFNNRVRMISGGTITTVAGTGTAGFSGDGKAATAAQLTDPIGVAVDSSGNLYIADAGNNVVRKVTSSGTISTIAGNNTAGYAGDTGDPTKAQLNDPVAVAVDSSGNVYIADANNNVIRMVSSTTSGTTVSSTISTIVGGVATPFTQLNHPDGLALGPGGTIYIADTGNKRIALFANGTLTSFAGNGSSAFSGDNGPALNASLNDPIGVAVDAVGNVYIADTLHNRIRKVSSSGIITTIAGQGDAFYGGDGGPAISAKLFFPHDVAIDSSGNVYVADTGNNVIRLLVPQKPVLNANGVVNGANFLSRNISPGALATIFGTNFASGPVAASVLPLPTVLGPVSVTVNGHNAPLLYVNATQVNFQVPWETQLGNALISVNVNGLISNSVSAPVLTAAPGLFVLPPSRALVQNSDSSLNGPDNAAKAGSTITAYLTGSGPVSPAVANGAPAPATPPLATVTSDKSVTIGSAAATVSFAGLAPGFVGLLQMNIVVPSTLAAGDYPLTITIHGELSNTATISVK